MPDDSIFIEGLTFNCIIGVLPHERHTEQPLRVDIDMAVDVRKAAATGDLTQSVHYGDVARRVEAFIREGRYELLETLAEATTTLLLSEYPISAVTLTVRKPAAIAGATAAGIRIHRAR